MKICRDMVIFMAVSGQKNEGTTLGPRSGYHVDIYIFQHSTDTMDPKLLDIKPDNFYSNSRVLRFNKITSKSLHRV